MSTPDVNNTESELEGVSDPSDFKQKRRIRSILNARDRVPEQERGALDFQAIGRIGSEFAKRMLRQAVKEYALESEHVIRGNLPDSGKDPREWSAEEEAAYHTWNERNLGTLEMRTEKKEFTGLKEFLETPPPITDHWVETDGDPIGGVSETIRREQYEIPMQVSERAYRALNYFWYEFGLDVDMDQKLPHDKI